MRLKTALTCTLERTFLLLDVLADDRQRCTAARCGEVRGRPQVSVHDGAVDPAGELLAYAAGGDALEAVDQFRDGDLGRVVHQEVDVIAFAVELLQLRLEVLAHLAHDLFAACQHLVVEDSTPVFRHEDQMYMHRRNDASARPVVVLYIHATNRSRILVMQLRYNYRA